MLEKKNRKRIPKENKVRAELQKEIGSICPYCDSTDVGHFVIHHIDEDPSNNNINNLLLLCPTCHSKITKGDIKETDVFKKKIEMITKPNEKDEKKLQTITFNKKVDNAVIGDKTKVTIKQIKKTTKQKYPEGCIGFETVKANYVSHLIKRFNEYKEKEVGKGNVNYAMFSSHLKKKYKIGPTRTIYNLPISKFGELISYIQVRIDNTMLAKIKGYGHKNYSTFEEYKKQNG